jgi:hypothetical protein
MLRARDVWDEQEHRREKRLAAMRPVLGQIQGKIRQQAIHDANAPYIVFEIPAYMWGYPIYQLGEARDYLMRELTEAGYQVWVVNEKYLMISWMKLMKSGTPQRPVLTTNYRPQVYDPTALGYMQNGLQ